MVDEKMYPVAFSLLPNKTNQTYVRLFTLLKNTTETVTDTVPSPEVIQTDFEAAVISAIAEVFPESSPRGCYFHYCQALWRHVVDYGLALDYKEQNLPVRSHVNRVGALPLLPIGEIHEAWLAVMDAGPNTPTLHQFSDSMTTSRPTGWTTTHAFQERYGTNMKLLARELTTTWKFHPNLYEFVKEIKKIESADRRLRLQIDHGAGVRSRPRKYKELGPVPQSDGSYTQLCYVKKKSVSLKKEQKLIGGGNAPANLTAIEEKVLSMIPTCQIDGVEGGMEVELIDACPGISTLVTLTSLMPISVVSSSLLSTSDSTLNTVASSTCSSTLKPVASSTRTSSTVTSAGTSAMKSAASVASGTSSSAVAEVVTVKEVKSKGKRKLEIKEEDPLEKLVAIEEKKVNKLDELTSIWKDFFLCTKAYQDRDLAIKDKLLAMKEKEKELCDYSVFPTVTFPNEY